MLQFLESHNLSYLLNSFILPKIDDTVAGDADTTKLMDVGLVHRDIISETRVAENLLKFIYR